MRYRSSEKHTRWFWREHDEDEYVCPDCGDDSAEYQVHHIDGNVGNGAMSNLVALCHDCHQARHEDLNRQESCVGGWKSAIKEDLMNGE